MTSGQLLIMLSIIKTMNSPISLPSIKNNRGSGAWLAKPNNMLPQFHPMDLGRIAFADAWKIQLDLVEQRRKDQIPDTLLICEHEPVYTHGKGSTVEPIDLPFPSYEIERGGKTTYHGPG